jgi:hypothetical protein
VLGLGQLFLALVLSTHDDAVAEECFLALSAEPFNTSIVLPKKDFLFKKFRCDLPDNASPL